MAVFLKFAALRKESVREGMLLHIPLISPALRLAHTMEAGGLRAANRYVRSNKTPSFAREILFYVADPDSYPLSRLSLALVAQSYHLYCVRIPYTSE